MNLKEFYDSQLYKISLKEFHQNKLVELITYKLLNEDNIGNYKFLPSRSKILQKLSSKYLWDLLSKKSKITLSDLAKLGEHKRGLGTSIFGDFEAHHITLELGENSPVIVLNKNDHNKEEAIKTKIINSTFLEKGSFFDDAYAKYCENFNSANNFSGAVRDQKKRSALVNFYNDLKQNILDSGISIDQLKSEINDKLIEYAKGKGWNINYTVKDLKQDIQKEKQRVNLMNKFFDNNDSNKNESLKESYSLKEFYQNIKESDEGDDLEAEVLQDGQDQIEQQFANQEQSEEENNIQNIKNSFKDFYRASGQDQIKIVDKFLSNLAGI